MLERSCALGAHASGVAAERNGQSGAEPMRKTFKCKLELETELQMGITVADARLSWARSGDDAK